ncbi:MAG: site-specific tyrosine recombinase XerD [Propionibacteriaceae bacterium]|jgi:integrase/recombinase XerD|nr:site-specific tyrosine recombinase XerD [Propionibacteriaceae bacterium]
MDATKTPAEAPDPARAAWEPLLREYTDHLAVERGLSRNTVAAYRRDLARYADHLAARGLSDARAVDAGTVAGFATSLRQAGLAPASVARMVVAVRGLHRFWGAEGRVAADVAADVEPPAVGSRLPKALSVEEVMALIEAAGASGPDAGSAELGDGALVELLYGTGARVSEVVALDVDDVTRLLGDATAGLRLLGKGGKERVVPVGSHARAALDAWLVRGRPALAAKSRRGTPALFLNVRGDRLSRQSAFNRVRALAARAGLKQDISPHTLRHSYATHLIDGGADVRTVQELLGHASVATTQIYTLVTLDHLREVYRAAHPRAL